MYLALDSGFLNSPAIEALGETHGPDGPMVVVALLCSAKMQGAKGEVRTTRRKLADDAFVGDRDRIDKIIRQAVDLGLLEELAIGDREIHVRFPRWQSWQQRKDDADRKAAERERKRAAALNGSDPEPVVT